MFPRGNCSSSLPAKNRWQSSKNKVLGAPQQRRAQGSRIWVDVARTASFNAPYVRSSFGTPFCFHSRFALEKPLSNLHAQTCSQARNRNGALCFPEPSQRLLHTHGAAPGSRAGPERSVKALWHTHHQHCVLNPHPITGQTELPCLVINDPLLRFPRRKQASSHWKELVSNGTALTAHAIHRKRGFDHELPLRRLTLRSQLGKSSSASPSSPAVPWDRSGIGAHGPGAEQS